MLGSSRKRLPELFIGSFLVIVIATIYWLRPFHSSERWHHIVQNIGSSTGLSKSKPSSTDHPIKQLHEAAVQKFDSFLSSQSTSLSDAVKEYERRYGRSPPPGFGGWYDLAVKHKSVLIDDFNMIHESMEPFWMVEPSTLRDLVQKSLDGPFVQLLASEKGTLLPSKENWMGERIRTVLNTISSQLPDFKITMNPLDEPRIILSEEFPTENVEWVDGSQKSAYSKAAEPCKFQTTRTSNNDDAIDTRGIPFLPDLWTMQDLCSNPEYESQHGFLISPDHIVTTDSPLPMLSQAIPSTFSDIVYPSMWYWDHELPDLEKLDMDWNKKRNKLYWSGRTTGGFIRQPDEGEKPFESHRHRFINITRQISNMTYDFLARDKAGDPWIKYSDEEVLSQLYETKFTGIVQCGGAHCEEMGKKYQIGEMDEHDVAFGYKFLMDLDGNSFSGRFYNLLASNSCVLKQTIFREWHDERLVPWLHYIPISISMKELPETMRYLALTTEGNEIAQRVAQAGKEWNKKMLRREDAAIYLHRLFLEYARVMSDDRDV